jgi:hypothetical protein
VFIRKNPWLRIPLAVNTLFAALPEPAEEFAEKLGRF